MASPRLWQRLFGGLFSRGVGKNESPSPPSAPQQPPKAAQGGVSRKAPTQRPPSPAVAPRQAPSDQGTGKRPAELSNLQTPTKAPQNQPRPADQVEPRALSELQSPVQGLPGQGPPVGGDDGHGHRPGDADDRCQARGTFRRRAGKVVRTQGGPRHNGPVA